MTITGAFSLFTSLSRLINRKRKCLAQRRPSTIFRTYGVNKGAKMFVLHSMSESSLTWTFDVGCSSLSIYSFPLTSSTIPTISEGSTMPWVSSSTTITGANPHAPIHLTTSREYSLSSVVSPTLTLRCRVRVSNNFPDPYTKHAVPKQTRMMCLPRGTIVKNE